MKLLAGLILLIATATALGQDVVPKGTTVSRGVQYSYADTERSLMGTMSKGTKMTKSTKMSKAMQDTCTCSQCRSNLRDVTRMTTNVDKCEKKLKKAFKKEKCDGRDRERGLCRKVINDGDSSREACEDTDGFC